MQIRNVDYERILEIAKRCFPFSVEIWAFGSRVKQSAHDGSDLDLVVINKSNRNTIKLWIQLFKENLRQSNIPILVQVLEWETLPSNYCKEIEKNHQVIFKK